MTVPDEKIDLKRYNELTYKQKKEFRVEWREAAEEQRSRAKRMAPIMFSEIAQGREVVIVRAQHMCLSGVDGHDVEVVMRGTIPAGGDATSRELEEIHDILKFSGFALLLRQISRQITNYFPDDVVQTMREAPVIPSEVDSLTENYHAIYPVDVGEISGSMFMPRGSLLDVVLFPSVEDGVEPFIVIIVDVHIDTLLQWGAKLEELAATVPQHVIDKGIVKVHRS